MCKGTFRALPGAFNSLTARKHWEMPIILCHISSGVISIQMQIHSKDFARFGCTETSWYVVFSLQDHCSDLRSQMCHPSGFSPPNDRNGIINLFTTSHHFRIMCNMCSTLRAPRWTATKGSWPSIQKIHMIYHFCWLHSSQAKYSLFSPSLSLAPYTQSKQIC